MRYSQWHSRVIGCGKDNLEKEERSIFIIAPLPLLILGSQLFTLQIKKEAPYFWDG